MEGLAELPGRLCGVFLGWRLREDLDALLALGEGSLRVDLLSGEAWCDGEPIPPLFIASELRRQLDHALAQDGMSADDLREARLDAVFARRSRWRAGREIPALELACRATLATARGEWSAEANSAEARAVS